MTNDDEALDRLVAGLDDASKADLIAEIDAADERERLGEQLVEEAQRLSGDLRAFIRGAWHVLEPATVYRHNWHIDAIAEHLQAAYDREIRRLIINIPPRRMKSLTVSTFGPAHRWTYKPSERFLTASYAADLAIEHAVNTRTLIQSTWYRARWGHVFALTGDQNVKSFYANDQRGYRIATSVGGTGTGRGGDVIVIDDPHNAKQAHLSEAARDEAITWRDQTISTRFNDPKTGVEILVMQRLHEKDLTGHLLAKDGGWVHLCLPEEYEPKLMVTLPGGKTKDATCPPQRELPSGRVVQGDPRDEPGELLWPEHAPRAAIETAKVDLGPYGTAGQLQQRPAPAEGGILKTAWWKFYDQDWLHEWRGEELVALLSFWDTTLKEKTSNDYCVGMLWGAAGANRYLLRRFRERAALPDTITAVKDQAAWAAEHFPNLPYTIKVENAANGPEVVKKLRDTIVGISTWNPETDKVSRAHAITPQLSAGQVFVPGRALEDGTGADPSITPSWVLEVLGECASFPNSANDDQVDGVTGGLLNLRGVFHRAPKRDEQERRPRDTTAGIRAKTF